MDINKNCDLVLRDLYLYDIESCHYSILKRIGFDVSNIDKDDKLKRNIEIGILMRDNPKITKILRDTTINIVKDFIDKNKICDDEIILNQYDGIITTRYIKDKNSENNITPILRYSLSKMIISINRNSYIALNSDNKVIIKGIPNRNNFIDELYSDLVKINFASKNSIFSRMEDIKNKIFSNNKISSFLLNEDNKKSFIFVKEIGIVEIDSSISNMISIDDIDKEFYFLNYIAPFTKSIINYFLF